MCFYTWLTGIKRAGLAFAGHIQSMYLTDQRIRLTRINLPIEQRIHYTTRERRTGKTSSKATHAEERPRNEYMDGRKDRRTEGWTNARMNELRRIPSLMLHVHRCMQYMLCMILSLLYSVISLGLSPSLPTCQSQCIVCPSSLLSLLGFLYLPFSYPLFYPILSIHSISPCPCMPAYT